MTLTPYYPILKEERRNKQMKKKSKKVKAEESSVYVFYNTITKVMLFVDAFHWDGAMEKFDLCAFEHRKDWKVFLECGSQPA